MRYPRIVAASLLSAGLTLSSAAQAVEPVGEAWLDLEVAVMQGLDKITARVSEFEVRIGETARFGTLLITPSACRKRPPTETPESAVYLSIDERRPDEAAARLFEGWMFASSPALNALEHPVYDVWPVDCISASTSGQSSSPK